jgi:hypothetical protein
MNVDTRVAVQFGSAIAQGDFLAAHALLTNHAQESHSPRALKEAVERMLANGDGRIEQVEVVSECVLDDRPDKQEEDVGYVYVALTGDGFSEAVTVTLTQEAGTIRIRDLQWGRP